jgi:hypothetical protein
MDYSKLEGKIIKLDSYGEVRDGKVALIEPNIGITIIGVDNPNHYMCCLVMPGSPKWQMLGDAENSYSAKRVEVIFDAMVEGIKEGVLIGEELTELYHSFGSGGSVGGMANADNCAFA